MTSDQTGHGTATMAPMPTRTRADFRGRIPSRHPYQVWSLGFLAIGGLGAIIAPQPTSIASLLPAWQRITWSALIVIAALIGLAAAWWRDPATGLLAEQAGHAGLAGGAAAYAGALIIETGIRGLVVEAILLGLTVAAIRRIIDIREDLRKLEVLAPGPGSTHHPDTPDT